MKKLKGALLLGALMIGLFTSCSTQPKKTEPYQQYSPLIDDNYSDKAGYTIRIIDSCEYIEVARSSGTTYGVYSLTHKGNCKNHSHSLYRN